MLVPGWWPVLFPGHANDYDGHKLKKLVEKGLSKGIEVSTVAGDKGYDGVILPLWHLI